MIGEGGGYSPVEPETNEYVPGDPASHDFGEDVNGHEVDETDDYADGNLGDPADNGYGYQEGIPGSEEVYY